MGLSSGFVSYAEIGRFNTTDRSERFEIRQIKKTIVHPNWDGVIPYNDIMLAVLESPVADVPTIELNRNPRIPFLSVMNSNPDDDTLVILGFGNTAPDPNPDDPQFATVLQQIETDYIPFEICSISQDPETGESYGNPDTGETSVSSDWLCTLRNDPSRVGTCIGDAGGPVILPRNKNLSEDDIFSDDLLVGVVSRYVSP